MVKKDKATTVVKGDRTKGRDSNNASSRTQIATMMALKQSKKRREFRDVVTRTRGTTLVVVSHNSLEAREEASNAGIE